MEHLLSFIEDRTREIGTGMIGIDAILITYYIILLISSKTNYTNKQLLQKALNPIFLVLIQVPLVIFLYLLINQSEQPLIKIALFIFMIGIFVTPPLIVGGLIKELEPKPNRMSQTKKEEVLVKDFSKDENESNSINDNSLLIIFMLGLFILSVLMLGFFADTFNS